MASVLASPTERCLCARARVSRSSSFCLCCVCNIQMQLWYKFLSYFTLFVCMERWASAVHQQPKHTEHYDSRFCSTMYSIVYHSTPVSCSVEMFDFHTKPNTLLECSFTWTRSGALMCGIFFFIHHVLLRVRCLRLLINSSVSHTLIAFCRSCVWLNARNTHVGHVLVEAR